MKTLVCFVILFFFNFQLDKNYFGFETIDAHFNKQKNGHWVLGTKKSEMLFINLNNQNDTLLFAGFCDSGCLDGTIIKIKDNDCLVTTLTRRSKSGILLNDTIIINPKSKEKQSFLLDNGVCFYASSKTLKRLTKNKIYNIFIQRVINKGFKDVHIFDLQIK